MSSDEPRPVKIYFIQLCTQQRHNKGTDQTARMRILIRMLVIHCSDNLFIGFCTPNSNKIRMLVIYCSDNLFIGFCTPNSNKIRMLVIYCSDDLFIGFCMPNSNLRRAAETKQAVVV